MDIPRMLPTVDSPNPSERPLVVVSNRLPVSVDLEGEGFSLRKSSGGLVSAMDGLDIENLEWFGWPGTVIPEQQRESVTAKLGEDGLRPVFLSAEQEHLYYANFCNAALWPLFHYFTNALELGEESWVSYRQVNELFAREIANHAPKNARVWIHDFHLMLVPSLLREMRADVEIGFFLHIPFPSSEIYRLIPQREELLRGVLGADYVSFHTVDYVRHFRSACQRVLGVDSNGDSVQLPGRSVALGVDPIGIDIGAFRTRLNSQETTRIYGDLEQRYQGRKLILGIERLDYTKGVPLKMRAFEEFLRRDPRRAEFVTMLQVLVPSRLSHPEYQSLKSEIEENVGRINGTYGRPGGTPIEYLHTSLTPEELVALYRFADVGFVAPVRDGMNLVAQEFVLCQGLPQPAMEPCKGILVLSEFAGAAHSLTGSLLVNPWDIAQTADALETALGMQSGERQDRMLPMMRRVVGMDCKIWADAYLENLQSATEVNRNMLEARQFSGTILDNACKHFRKADRRVLFLDYDGTLRELVSRPEEAMPTPEIYALLEDLTALPETDVHIVSGRSRDDMQRWFGHLPLHLSAEHGYTTRAPGQDWMDTEGVDLTWMPRVEQLLGEVTKEVPGTMTEVKTAAIAWHYRMADPDYSEWRARELLNSLEAGLAHDPVEITTGHRVVEVRSRGVHKGRYVRTIMRRLEPQTPFLLCLGDDRTDRDMYAAMPKQSYVVHVGGRAQEARFTLDDPAAVRGALQTLIESFSSVAKEQPQDQDAVPTIL